MTRHLPERWKVAAAIAVTAALFTPLLVLGGPALAGSGPSASQYGPSASQYQYRIVICHFTHSRKHPAHTITVSSHAWKGHARHGDHLGACTDAEKLSGNVKPHGKSGEQHGRSGDHHGNNGKNGGDD